MCGWNGGERAPVSAEAASARDEISDSSAAACARGGTSHTQYPAVSCVLRASGGGAGRGGRRTFARAYLPDCLPAYRPTGLPQGEAVLAPRPQLHAVPRRDSPDRAWSSAILRWSAAQRAKLGVMERGGNRKFWVSRRLMTRAVEVGHVRPACGSPLAGARRSRTALRTAHLCTEHISEPPAQPPRPREPILRRCRRRYVPRRARNARRTWTRPLKPPAARAR